MKTTTEGLCTAMIPAYLAEARSTSADDDGVYFDEPIHLGLSFSRQAFTQAEKECSEFLAETRRFLIADGLWTMARGQDLGRWFYQTRAMGANVLGFHHAGLRC